MSAITVDQVKKEAVQQFFNNGGSSSDFITQEFYLQAMNNALEEIWEKIVAGNLSFYNIQEEVINVVAGTSEYDVTLASTDVDRIIGLAQREGSAPYYNYNIIPPAETARDYFQLKNNNGGLYTAGGGFNNYTWIEGESGLDGSGNFIRKIKLLPVPTSNFTVVWNGQRKPARLPASITPTSDETTTYLDIPSNFRRSIVYRVVRDCMMRDKTDTGSIDRKVDSADFDALGVHSNGLNKQTPRVVTRTR